jgi:hypothetical protein
MKRFAFALTLLLLAALACGPGSTSTKEVGLTVTTFIDESGKGEFSESYQGLPNTLILAKWNQHGAMYREVQITDANGQASFSVGYTHFFDISVVPPCGYESTTPLQRDMTRTKDANFGFWPANPVNGEANVKLLIWKDTNSNGTRDPQEEVTGEKASVMFDVPGGTNGNVYDQDNFLQESQEGWFDIHLGNSCGAVYVLLVNSALTTRSVSEPGRDSDASSHGNTFHAAIEIPYGLGETIVYWEIK